MARKYHFVRILEEDYQLIQSFKKEYESDCMLIKRIFKVYAELPEKYLIIG